MKTWMISWARRREAMSQARFNPIRFVAGRSARLYLKKAGDV